MGKIISFRAQSENESNPLEVRFHSAHINALVTQLQTSAREIVTALETTMNATACFQRYEISPVHCARAAAALHHLLQQVQELYRLVESLSPFSAKRYPVLIQAHHVEKLLEQTIHAIQEVQGQRGNLHKYLPTWREAQRQVRTYPAQVTDLVEKLAHYCQAIVNKALS